jgi:hypothetical protein
VIRSLLHAVLVVSLAAGALLAAEGQGVDASQVLAAARQALGGEEKLAAVRTFIAAGRTRQVRGNNLVPIEFEIACELPDKYVRRDEIPAQESGPTATGFNGEGLIQVPPPPEASNPANNPAKAGSSETVTAAAAPAGRAGGPPPVPPDPRKTRVASVKQDFVRLTLGMFAASFSGCPLTFTLDGVAEAPQGKADIIDVKGPGAFTARLFVNRETHLPIMVSWTMPATSVVLVVPGQPAPANLPPGSIKVDAPPAPAPTASKEEQTKYAKDVQDLRMKTLKSAKPVEYRLYYAD